MTTSRFLEYEVALLLAKYGKEPVLLMLAEKLGCAQTELEALMTDIEKKKAIPAGSRAAPTADQIETIISQHPEKASRLRVLNSRFRNRTFLPELRDVRRFFEQHSRNLGHTKSRAKSLSKLLKLLAELDLTELDTLSSARESGEYSSLGIISDEILRRDR